MNTIGILRPTIVDPLTESKREREKETRHKMNKRLHYFNGYTRWQTEQLYDKKKKKKKRNEE